MMINGERAKGWLSALMPVLREGGPVSLLLALVMAAMVVWLFMQQRSTTRELHKLVLAEKDKHVDISRMLGVSEGKLAECYMSHKGRE